MRPQCSNSSEERVVVKPGGLGVRRRVRGAGHSRKMVPNLFFVSVTCFLSPFFKKKFKEFWKLLIFRGRGRDWERKGEKHKVQEKHGSVASHTPPAGDLACIAGMCPRLGIEPATLSVCRPALKPLSHISQGPEPISPTAHFFHLYDLLNKLYLIVWRKKKKREREKTVLYEVQFFLYNGATLIAIHHTFLNAYSSFC